MKSRYFEGLTGAVITPHDPGYEEARQEWNRAIQRYPIAIVYCRKKTDVSNAICWARKRRVGIRIRSRGHHYEGYSTGNCILVIDISKLQRVEINAVQGTVTVEGGVNNSQLYEALGAKGYSFPGGTCPTVGVTGYTLGGGWGYSSRLMGLGCDSLLELEIIDYTGRCLRVNKSYNADMFWALRGAGGGNLGIVVSLTFKLPPKDEGVTLVQLYYPNASRDTMVDFMEIWQKWLEGLDPKLTMSASLYYSIEDNTAIYGRGIFFGSAEEAEPLLKPFTDIEGADLSLEEMSFYEAMQKVQAAYPSYEKFKSTGRFVHKHYDRCELEEILAPIFEAPQGSVFAAITLYALGGRVAEVDKRETAFYFRSADYIMGIQSVWEKDIYAEENVEWVQKGFNYIKAITFGSYVNFPFSPLEDYERAYYGENAQRLRKINEKYDPFNVFNFPQAIK